MMMFSKLFGPEPEWVEISQEELITTAQFYLSVLVDERKEFLSGLDDQMKDKVGGSQLRQAPQPT
jgi:hypothetical protein